MKISELIEKLQHQQNLWGDLPVYHDRSFGDKYCFEEIYIAYPVYPQYISLKEDTIQSPWCIELI